MNERDVSLAKNLMKKINEVREDNSNLSLAVDTSFTQIAKTNLLLLKGFLDLEGKKGCFVVLDRPHQYMAYLLHMHDISQENIWYIDTVSRMSGQEKEEGENVNFVKGPFYLEHLFDAFESDDEKGTPLGSSEEVDFVLVDNISSMLNYNTMEKVEEFIRSFKDLISDSNGMVGCLVIDSSSYPQLDKTIKGHIDSYINIEDCQEDG
ncbi:MAG: hypothetical protein ACLFVL_00420 [Candidatus Aenigmatarchaeota archaeon]